jgi:hypothetical protein
VIPQPLAEGAREIKQRCLGRSADDDVDPLQIEVFSRHRLAVRVDRKPLERRSDLEFEVEALFVVGCAKACCLAAVE